MSSGRLEYFSDAVLAIIITIMVLEIKIPAGYSWDALAERGFSILIYIISFSIIAIYWNNHHHLVHLVKRVNGRLLWANMAFLLVVSFIPFATSWLGEHPEKQVPELIFGFVFLLLDIQYDVLAIEIYRAQDMGLHGFRKTRWFGKMIWSLFCSMIGISLSWLGIPYLIILTVIIGLIPWIVPDKEIERNFHDHSDKTSV